MKSWGNSPASALNCHNGAFAADRAQEGASSAKWLLTAKSCAALAFEAGAQLLWRSCAQAFTCEGKQTCGAFGLVPWIEPKNFHRFACAAAARGVSAANSLLLIAVG